MKIRKKYLITPVILLLAGFLIYYAITSTRTVYNDAGTAGNTAGNLFNGGLYCAYNEKIYFSNINDSGALYTMDLNLENYKKINKDKAGYINAAGNYLYYSRMDNLKQSNSPNVYAFKNVGIYRTNLKGGALKSLYDNPAGLINLYGNSLFYQHYNSKNGLKLYKVDIDGTSEKKLSNDPVIPISIQDGKLIFAGVKQDHFIYSMNLISGIKSILYEENCYAPVINNSYIYFLSLSDNYSIYRIGLTGEDPVPIIEERCSTFNLTQDGSYIYYQVDDGQNNRLAKMNLQTGETQDIKYGNYKNINIAGDYVFFMDFEEKEAYYMNAGIDNTFSVFNPPKLTD